MTHPSWRPGSIDSAASACEFVASVWDDERIPPMRLHEHAVQPRDLLGAPRWSAGFSHLIFDSPFAEHRVRDTIDGVVVDRWFYRYPLERALALLAKRDHDRWTKGVMRRPFHPSVVGVLRAMARADFDAEHVMLRYKDSTKVPDEMAELFVIGAARKLRSVYAEEVVGPHIEKSESQHIAEAS